MTTIELTDVLFYRNGRSGASRIVGNDTGTSEGRRVARYTFTAPASGANREKITFHVAELSDGSHIPVRFYIGTDPESHANAGPGYEYTGVLSMSDDVHVFSGTADVLLMPGKTYYLWAFPGTDGFGYYGWGRTNYTSVIDLHGAAALLNLVSGGAWRKIMPCVVPNGKWFVIAPVVVKDRKWHYLG